MQPKRFWTILILIHLGFMCKQLFFSNSLIQDSKEYLLAAENLLEYKTLYAWHLDQAFNPDWLTKRPFLYPMILAFFKVLSFGNSNAFFFLAYLFQNAASLFSIFLCIRILDHLNIAFNGKQALVFLCFSLSQFIYANFIMSEIYLQVCMLGAAYVLICKSMHLKHYVGIAFLLIAGMSLKPVLMLTAFLFPLVYLLFKFKHFKLQIFTITLLPLLFYFSMCEVNSKRTGYFHYSSISNINLLHYNTYSVLMYKYGAHQADSMVDKIHIKAQLMPVYADQENYIKATCKDMLLQHSGTYTYLHLRGIVFSIFDPGRFDITQFFNLSHTKNFMYEVNKKDGYKTIVNLLFNPLGLLLLLLGIFNVFRFIFALRFIFSKSVHLHLKLIIIAFPVYLLGLTGPIGTSRFFMPLIPFALLAFLIANNKKASN